MSTIIKPVKSLALSMCWYYAIYNNVEVAFPSNALSKAKSAYLPHKEKEVTTLVKSIMDQEYCDFDIIGWSNGLYNLQIHSTVNFIMELLSESYDGTLN